METHIIPLVDTDTFWKNDIKSYMFADLPEDIKITHLVITIQKSHFQDIELITDKKTEKSEQFKDDCLENFMKLCERMEGSLDK